MSSLVSLRPVQPSELCVQRCVVPGASSTPCAGVELPAVDDADARHACLERRAAGRQLRHHARRRRAARDQRVDAGERRASAIDRPSSSSTPACRAGDHEIAAAERGRDAARHHVGVHVQDVGRPRRVLDAEARDDRHVAVRRAATRRATVGVGRIADEAEIDHARRWSRDAPRTRRRGRNRRRRRSAQRPARPAPTSAATSSVFDGPGEHGTRPRRASAASVTRRPSTFFGAMPRRSSSASIARPPPCTTTSGRVAATHGARNARDARAGRRRSRAARRRA